ncbi:MULTISPECIES: chromate transporter [unclassified Enterococcus]|uniref:chromate transporter n=1 Tax=unclassified Enterococcus TaxID=2608891 RepID=UPI00155615C2|nr:MULTISPECIES: chromate transporter [unclassified Enterococcus]MBS7577029.1 chromate transporter [Enterococcus sp. MMGLQ5-2]MBS7584524.1 chromate transporter [Enterococcus sp. MMGLQ5-1]NPD12379.1 chromate transporter [Enterococcus sp. MMGLQ5-1]NPD36863.1 chromate transporter [Enterococcus sp. MMGLQ5-2]
MPRKSTNLILFKTFFIASLFTFAGGLAMLPVLQRDLVESNQLIDEDDFLEYATLSQTLPGMIVLNFACFVGKKLAGWRGMFYAAFGAILPAFVLMLAATMLYSILPMTTRLQSAFLGIRAASSAMILTAAITLYQHNIRNRYGILVLLISLSLLFILNLSAPLVLLIAALFGFTYYRFSQKGVKK